MSTDDQMSIEDRVRAATRAGASLINDVRPLDAPAPVRLRRRPRPAPRRWASWGVPLAAAAAVAAIALTLVAVRQAGPPAPASSGSGTAAPSAVPRYYVTGVYNGQEGPFGALLVGDDLTGKLIATVSPPPGLVFQSVRGTSDDRTFIAQAAVGSVMLGKPPLTWYLLRIAPGSAHPYQLTKLPVKLPGNRTSAAAYALSPDGRELAVESTPGIAGNGNVAPVITLGVYSVATGARLRAWTAPASGTTELTTNTLSWLDGSRRLVFSATSGSNQYPQLRALDVTGASTDLVAGSRALFTVGNPATCSSLQVTPDGGTVICATPAGSPGHAGGAGCAHAGPRLTAFPLPGDRAGGLVRTLYLYPGACHDGTARTLWTGASANSVIGMTIVNTSSDDAKEGYHYQVVAITGGRFRPLNIAKGFPPDDYAELAF